MQILSFALFRMCSGGLNDDPLCSFFKMPKQYNLKYISLILLIVQTTCVVLLLRYSRTKATVPYTSSTAIVASEVMKGAICIVLVWIENGK